MFSASGISDNIWSPDSFGGSAIFFSGLYWLAPSIKPKKASEKTAALIWESSRMLSHGKARMELFPDLKNY